MKHPVAIQHRPSTNYPITAPFDPPQRYPEMPGDGALDPSNTVYDMVRESFRSLRLDADNDGTSAWNPFRHRVQPGQTVFIKPNMIAHRHAQRDEWDYVITHGAVIRAVVDYVYLALRGKGRIIIGDGPQTDSDFDAVVARMGLGPIRTLYQHVKGFDIDIVDLRQKHWVAQDGIYTDTVPLAGDPRGCVRVDLRRDSQFAEHDGCPRTYYGAYYDVKETNRHHHDGRHEYSMARTPLEADVFINIPKLKTHKKCGLTVNLKSLVGIACDKNWLPHYAFGDPATGGDQFDHLTWRRRVENALVLRGKTLLLGGSRAFTWLARRTKGTAYSVFGPTHNVIRSGNWSGNDTVWRMCLDLNRILLYANPDGTLRPADSPKRFFSVVDGIAAMEGDGPVSGTRKPAGVIVAGDNPVAVDVVCARLMGFDHARIPLVARALDPHRYPLIVGSADDIETISNHAPWRESILRWSVDDTLRFQPHFGWKGSLEMEPRE